MRRSVVLAVLFLAATTSSVWGQGQGWDPTGLQHTRAELLELLKRYEQSAQAEGYSEQVRAQARADAALVRQRLEEGDLRVGDRVVIIVEGYPALTDTFSVGANRSLVMPEIGEVPLTGILRSELQAHLSAHVARFIRDPVVRARSLIRLQMLGAVGRPGYYTIPSDILLSDALMLAGGPVERSALDKMSIQRGDEELWSAERVREALREGRTLDQLSVRAGDTIVVPERATRGELLQRGLLVLTSVATLLVLARQTGVF